MARPIRARGILRRYVLPTWKTGSRGVHGLNRRPIAICQVALARTSEKCHRLRILLQICAGSARRRRSLRRRNGNLVRRRQTTYLGRAPGSLRSLPVRDLTLLLSPADASLVRRSHLSITRFHDRHIPPATFAFADWIDRFPNISRLNIDWSPSTRDPDFIQLETASNHRRPRVVSANRQLSIVDITILDRSEVPSGDRAAGIQELEYIMRQIEFPQIQQLYLQIYPRRFFASRRLDAGIWDSLGQALNGAWCPDLRKFALTLELRHNNFPSAIDLVVGSFTSA
jgi:hypothetical protein